MRIPSPGFETSGAAVISTRRWVTVGRSPPGLRFAKAQAKKCVDICIHKALDSTNGGTMEFDGFDWDEGNRAKCQKHGVSVAEIEGLFRRPVVILPDKENP